jgi:hypothetical protein
MPEAGLNQLDIEPSSEVEVIIGPVILLQETPIVTPMETVKRDLDGNRLSPDLDGFLAEMLTYVIGQKKMAKCISSGKSFKVIL